MTILQLSPYVLPQVRMGSVRLSPVNMVVSPERVAYVEGLYAHVQALVAQVAKGRVTREQVERLCAEAFLARGLVSVDWDHAAGPRVELWEHAKQWVSFDEDALGILFADGRLRDERDMVFRSDRRVDCVGDLAASRDRPRWNAKRASRMRGRVRDRYRRRFPSAAARTRRARRAPDAALRRATILRDARRSRDVARSERARR